MTWTGPYTRYQIGLAPAIVLVRQRAWWGWPRAPGRQRAAGHRPLPPGNVWPAASAAQETSCYECLRNFYNQWCHDQLRRGVARDFLAAIAQQNLKAGP